MNRAEFDAKLAEYGPQHEATVEKNRAEANLRFNHLVDDITRDIDRQMAKRLEDWRTMDWDLDPIESDRRFSHPEHVIEAVVNRFVARGFNAEVIYQDKQFRVRVNL